MRILVAAVLALSFAGQSFAQDSTAAAQQANDQIQAPVTAPAVADVAVATTASTGGIWTGAVVGIGALAVIAVAIGTSGGHNSNNHGTTGTTH